MSPFVENVHQFPPLCPSLVSFCSHMCHVPSGHCTCTRQACTQGHLSASPRDLLPGPKGPALSQPPLPSHIAVHQQVIPPVFSSLSLPCQLSPYGPISVAKLGRTPTHLLLPAALTQHHAAEQGHYAFGDAQSTGDLQSFLQPLTKAPQHLSLELYPLLAPSLLLSLWFSFPLFEPGFQETAPELTA